MWLRIRSPRPSRAAGGLVGETVIGVTTAPSSSNSSGSGSNSCASVRGDSSGSGGSGVDKEEAEEAVADTAQLVECGRGSAATTYGPTIMEESTIFEVVDRDSLQARMALPPRYRFRDLLLGDFAFNDDGER